MKFSRFTYEHNGKNHVCLYNSVLLKKAYLKRNEWEPIESFYKDNSQVPQNDVTRKLYEEGFIVDDKEDNRTWKIVENTKPKEVMPEVMFLVLTEDCNFRCKYCFENENPKKLYMSKKTAKKALDMFCAENNKNAEKREIYFYGGEPLLNHKTFDYSLGYIKELFETGKLKKPTILNLITNGSLIDKRIEQNIDMQRFNVAVSLDGPKEIHNEARIYSGGKGTYDNVIRGINILKDNGVNFGLSCTIGKHNVDSLDKIMEWFVTDVEAKSVGFNILLHQTGGTNTMSAPIEKVTKKIIDAFEIAREHGIYEDRILRQVRAFSEEMFYPYDCGGCGRQIVYTPDDKIGPCLAFLGTKEYFVPVKNEKLEMNEKPIFREWLDRSTLTLTECKECENIGVCGGGCHYNAYRKNGDIHKKDEDYCKYVTGVLDWLVLDLEDKILSDTKVSKLPKQTSLQMI